MQKIATEKTARTVSTPLFADSHSREFELLRLTARTTIDSQTRERIGSLVDTAIDWNFLVQTAHEHRVLPLIYRTFADGFSDRVPKHAMERLRKAFYANAKRNLFLTAELFQVLMTFEQHDIPVIPYKGPILAAALYGEVSLREFSDLDVIVPKDLVERATALLIDRGYRMTTEAGGDAFGLIDKAKDLLLVRDDIGINFELHWGITIEKDPLQVNPEFLWENVSTLSVAGKRVKIHAPEDLLLILCIHGGKHRWEHLGWLCDVAEIIRRYPELDWAKVIDRASTLGGRRILFVGLLLAHNVLGAPLPNDVDREIEADHVAAELAEQVQHSLASDIPLAVGDTEQYYIRLRERPADKARIAVNQVKHYLMLTPRDRELLPLSGPFSAILYFVRPFRLMWEYGMDPFWRFFKSTLESGSNKKQVRERQG
jgi:Uncharacterised nucleotidyltransferase